jgi:hypothetical protein
MRATRAAAGVVLALALSSCGYSGLAFKEDSRVSILEPSDREEVRAPITLDWEATDLAPGTTFAVFIDRSPPPPGRSVAWLFRDDDTCDPDDGCPDAEFLADRDIFVTDETEIIIEGLSRQRDDDRRELHEATIVLIGPEGDRLGESAFIREFALEREAR